MSPSIIIGGFVIALFVVVIVLAANPPPPPSAFNLDDYEEGTWTPHEIYDIPPGVYYRADSSAKGGEINAHNMALGETGVRELLKSGFRGYDGEDETFVVTGAPEGFSDTIGRRFKKEPAKLLNWAN